MVSLEWLLGRKTNAASDQGFGLRQGPTAGLIIFGFVLIAAITIGTAVMIDQFRQSAIEGGKQELEDAVLLLVRHFDRQFEDFEVLGSGIAEELESSRH